MAKTKQKITKQHEREYIHIPKTNKNWFAKLGGFVFFLFLSIVNFKLILFLWKDLSLSNLLDSAYFNQLLVLYPFIGQYLFISLTIICVVGLFKRLNSYDEDGLIYELIYGLIGGLIYGLVVGLIGGLVVGLIYGLMEEFN